MGAAEGVGDTVRTAAGVVTGVVGAGLLMLGTGFGCRGGRLGLWHVLVGVGTGV
jgi:hypothetical protein